MANVPLQSFADSSHGGIVERHMLCAQSPMLLAASGSASGSSRLHSSMTLGAEINKQL